jgi:hypothetical protein
MNDFSKTIGIKQAKVAFEKGNVNYNAVSFNVCAIPEEQSEGQSGGQSVGKKGKTNSNKKYNIRLV